VVIAGAPVVAAYIAHIAFWALLVVGVLYGAIRTRGGAVFLALWVIGYAALPRFDGNSGFLMTAWLAILDIALVLIGLLVSFCSSDFPLVIDKGRNRLKPIRTVLSANTSVENNGFSLLEVHWLYLKNS